jgi:F0F1-type ATP synthase assembly protein I
MLAYAGSGLSGANEIEVLTEPQDGGHETSHNKHGDKQEVQHQGEQQGNEEHVSEHGDEGGHHASMDPLFFIILALIIGAATRHFLQKSPLPFTVMLLIFGLIAGVLARVHFFESWNFGFTTIDVSIVSRSVKWAANIDPHLLLFTFLPILIFEAAFAMDVHTF